MNKLAVVCEENVSGAEALAARLGLPLLQEREFSSLTCSEYSYVLLYSEQGLALQQTGKKAAGPVLVDFASGASEYRRTKGGGELLVKALGGDKQHRPSVLDATAGLGRDSFVMASWGYSVTLLERSPVIAALLADGLSRGATVEDSELNQIVSRMHLLEQDACDYLSSGELSGRVDVIYLDPMFPVSKKSALVKKEMQAFHHVIGKEADDAGRLLELALDKAVYRVVVKRPVKAEYLADKKPNYSLTGKSVRFDIYTLKTFGK
jgi:16S rRNA (guanine1516-N2)-methyltransferase